LPVFGPPPPPQVLESDHASFLPKEK